MTICKNCGLGFKITTQDIALYQKLNVPQPTFCPTCRLIRRLAVRNERLLYKSTCASCKKSMLSMYDHDSPYTVYCTACYWSDSWSAMDYGCNYDFNKPFFSQFHGLQLKVPRENLWQIQCAHSPYANFLREAKNSYLSYSCVYTEDVYYSKNIDRSRNIFDSLDVSNSENCYAVTKGDRNSQCAFLVQSNNCLDSWFLYNCHNCSSCFLCTNLRGKRHFFMNREYSKEEYQNQVAAFYTGDYAKLTELQEEFGKLVKNSIHKYANITSGIQSSGDDLMNVKFAFNCFSCYNLENVSHALRSFNARDSSDLCNIYENELMYECVSGGTKQSSRVLFTMHGFSSLRDVQYTDSCHNSHDLFGCVGMRRGECCILNKQYSEDEYKTLVPKIIDHMNAVPYRDTNSIEYRYGEFFPIELSPFAYNETYAMEYFPLTKPEVLSKGYVWKEIDQKKYVITLDTYSVPNIIGEVNDSIVNEVIECAHAKNGCNEQCATAFKIVPKELEFYREMHLPFPRLCPNCRHYERLKQRNPLKLWKRKCACNPKKNTASHYHGQNTCFNEFMTTYAPDRPELVYCGDCYNAEIT